jgi:hypothetical protein
VLDLGNDPPRLSDDARMKLRNADFSTTHPGGWATGGEL